MARERVILTFDDRFVNKVRAAEAARVLNKRLDELERRARLRRLRRIASFGLWR